MDYQHIIRPGFHHLTDGPKHAALRGYHLQAYEIDPVEFTVLEPRQLTAANSDISPERS